MGEEGSTVRLQEGTMKFGVSLIKMEHTSRLLKVTAVTQARGKPENGRKGNGEIGEWMINDPGSEEEGGLGKHL